MLAVWKRPAAVLVAAAVVLGGAGRAFAEAASTTTTTTTTSTTTTVPPHPFSDATAACVRDAYRARDACKRRGGTTCRKDLETAYPKCFAAGAGVTCAKRCITRETTCAGAVPATKKTCRTACRKALVRDVRACRRIADGDTLWAGGDAGCLSTAHANRDLCGFVCSQAGKDCRTALKFCVANCANL